MIKVSDGFYGIRKKIIYCSFAVYEIIAVLLASNFNFNGWNIVSRGLQAGAGGIILAVLLFDLIKKRIKINALTVVCGVCFALTTYFVQTTQLAFFFIFMCAFGGYKFEDFAKFALKLLIVSVSVVTIFALLGVIPETESIRGNDYRIGLGFKTCTLTASLFMFIVLTYNYLKKHKISFSVLIIETVIACLVYYATKARTGFSLTIIIVLCSFFSKIFVGGTRYNNSLNNKFCCVKFSLVALPVIFMLIYGLSCILYAKGVPIFQKFNEFLSGRLQFTVDALNHYQVTLFGQKINWFNDVGEYIGVDCSYFYFLFTYGIINTAILLIGAMSIMYFALKRRNNWLVFAFLICLIDGVVEPYLDDFKYNFFSLVLSPFILSGRYYIKNRQGCSVKDHGTCVRLGNSVVAVVVTFNRKILLRESLLALLKANYENLKMVVVDNASTDGTYDYVKDVLSENPDKIKYFNTGKNIGGAGGFNFGIKKALEINADYIWLMDDDCVVENASLNELINAAHDLKDDFGFLSSKVLWKDGSISKMNLQRRNIFDKWFDTDKNLQNIRIASFVSLFLNGKAVEAVGLPYKEFFIWGDDWEYTYRISKNYKCYYVADSVVIHKSSVNMGSNISLDDISRIDRYFYSYRNEGFLYRKNGLSETIYFIAKLFYHIFKVVFSKSNSKKQRLSIIFKGFFASWRFNPKTEYAFKADTEIKVLEFFGEPISYGGQESVVKNLYKNSAWENIKFIFCTPFFCNNTDFINFAEKREDDIIANGKKFDSKFRKLSIICTAKNVFSDEKYDVAHIHAGSVFSLAVIVRAAKRAGVKKVVVHAHSGGINKLSYRIMKKFSDLLLKKYADVYMCCSEIAASWKFPKQIVDKKQYLFLKNGVNTDKFTFDEKIRREYRGNLLIEEMPIICQVARFTEQKNHTFTLKILKALSDRNLPFKALIIGDGPLKSDFEKGVGLLGLQDKIIYFEQRDDIPQMLCASDVFILPSLYEGLPVAAVESQTTGLITLMSDKIAPETKVIDLAHFLPIDSKTDADVWASAIINRQKVNRKLCAQQVREAGFDIRDSAIYLEKVYRGYNR